MIDNIKIIVRFFFLISFFVLAEYLSRLAGEKDRQFDSEKCVKENTK